MRVAVDLELCASTGSCAQIAPQVFEIRSDGLLHVLSEEPPEELRAVVVNAADMCPTSAITIDA